ETELADILNQLPNKSAFIRKAIVNQLDMACPLCSGAGMLPKGLHDHFAPLVAKLNNKACEECGDKAVVLASTSAELQPQDRARLEQFFHGGPFYCSPCYTKASSCNACGWHIAEDQIKKHQRQQHHI
ncbi:MAG TPA: hypothetical protein PKA06_15040, partial [Gemmatales bacterium]|nr:hypothetical protein [Gemmatales bacterium]